MTTEPTRLNGVSIVLVEDDVTLGDGFAQVLRAAGYDVWLTTSADEALERIKIVGPSAIVVDFRMPLINGLGFLYRLRAAEGDRRTPVAVVTGNTSLDADVKQQLEELGAELRLKPIMPNELLDLVRGMVCGPTARQKQRTVS
jgi:DNA-binding response OmpR family regulator